MPHKPYRPVVLTVLDGWGINPHAHGNAIAAAAPTTWARLLATYPHTQIDASGEAVGLPAGVMGNSEVGHMNLGSGRVVAQGVTIIDADIASGEFKSNTAFSRCIEHVRASGGTLHVLGLLSDGKVHSSISHLFAIIDGAVAATVPFAIHAFLDGRDTPPRSARTYIDMLEEHLANQSRPGTIATVCGRFYAMDRDSRWERTQAAYDMLARAQAPQHAATAREAIKSTYERGLDDEFIEPTIIGVERPIKDGDACIFFNFRPDRARQLTAAFNHTGFTAFPTIAYEHLLFATMTKYEESNPNLVLFGPRPQYDTFGEIISHQGLSQLRLAETEKYAHVTYFFNGGREDVFPGEDRKLIASDRTVETYDLAPQMRASEITEYAVAQIEAARYDVIVMNYANADMVGHTGKWQPTVESIEILDACLAKLSSAVLAAGGLLVITADHGNAEEKIDANGNPLTAHTTNPVPLLFVGEGIAGTPTSGGKLGDVAPTILHLMGIAVPPSMTGNNLFAPIGVMT